MTSTLVFATEWEKIKTKGVDAFINVIESDAKTNFSPSEFIRIYDIVYNLFGSSEPNKRSIYMNIKTTIDTYIDSIVIPKIKIASTQGGPEHFVTVWNDTLHKIFMVGKGFCKLFFIAERNNPIVKNKCMYQLISNFHTKIVTTHGKTIAKTVMDMIDSIRSGNQLGSQSQLEIYKKAVDVSITMGQHLNGNEPYSIYMELFESNFIEKSKVYYQIILSHWDNSVYLETYKEQVKKETDILLKIIPEPSVKKFKQCFYEIAIVSRIQWIFDNVVSLESPDSLGLLYQNIEQPDLNKLATAFETVIKTAIAKKLEQTSSITDTLVQFYSQIQELIIHQFENSVTFYRSLNKIFEDIIGDKPQIMRQLAFVMHKQLCKDNKNFDERIVDSIIRIYGCSNQKDLFEYEYQRFLATRLIDGNSNSEHEERSIIAKLKNECGYHWTNRLETMLKDVAVSKTLNTQEILEVLVCTTGVWPNESNFKGNVPQELKQEMETFNLRYCAAHGNRKLNWRLDQGRAELQVQFALSRHILSVTTYQMMILHVFNDNPVVSYQQILDITGVPTMFNHIMSLAHPSVGILEKKPNNNKLEPDHKFRLNPAFTSKMMRIQVPLMKFATENATSESTEKQDEIIAIQRKHQMDASIVRIMKSRKTLSHTNLVMEVITQLSARFKPSPIDIKKRIEYLIEQEYLERSAQDRGVYTYLA